VVEVEGMGANFDRVHRSEYSEIREKRLKGNRKTDDTKFALSVAGVGIFWRWIIGGKYLRNSVHHVYTMTNFVSYSIHLRDEINQDSSLP
jgi:hypothetical protein